MANTQRYVSAARALGYQHPDLTRYESQVWDCYDGEDGLDLRVLDDDCSALWAVLATAEEELRRQRAQLTALAAAWSGPGAGAAAGFLRSHCDTAESVTAGVRAAARGCDDLRDTLWRLVDAKVAAAIAIDDRSVAERPVWLAAAAAVTAGVGDRAATDDVVTERIIPYLDTHIRTDWLTAMRSTRAAVADAYDTAVDAARSAPAAYFAIPDHLGPRDQPPPAATAWSVPGRLAVPAAAADPADPVLPPVTPVADAVPSGVSGLPAGIGAPGDLGLGRLIGGLLGGPALGDGALDDPGFEDDAFDGRHRPHDDPPADTGEIADGTGDDPDDTSDAGEPVRPAAETGADLPAQADVADVAADTVAGQAEPGGPTPCDLAANELPQVGR